MERYFKSFVALAVIVSGAAHADTLNSVPDGGQLVLSQTWSSTGPGQSPTTVTGTGVNGDGLGVGISNLTPAGTGSFVFNQTFKAPNGSFAASNTINGASYGFTSSYVVSVPASVAANALVFSLNLGSTTALTNLTARLYAYSAGTNQILGGTGAVSGLVQDWTIGTGGTQVMLPTSAVAGGEYVLEIAGLESGTASGTYIGALDIAPVPLPAALPLLVSALGGLGLFRRRSLAAA